MTGVGGGVGVDAGVDEQSLGERKTESSIPSCNGTMHRYDVRELAAPDPG